MKQIQGCTNIVIDGANVIHYDFDIVMKDKDGNRLTQIRPERLQQAIEYGENLGWKFQAPSWWGSKPWHRD